MILDSLESILKKSKENYSSLTDSITRAQFILGHADEPLDSRVQDDLQKFEYFLKKNGDDDTQDGDPNTIIFHAF